MKLHGTMPPIGALLLSTLPALALIGPSCPARPPAKPGPRDRATLPSSHLRLAKRRAAPAKKARQRKKQRSLASLLELETDLRARGRRYVIGSDDAGGGGCLAGPVVVASCCALAPPSAFLPRERRPGAVPPASPDEGAPAVPPSAAEALVGVRDCKELTAAQRREIHDIVMEHPDVFAVSIAQRSPAQIDATDLARATQEAFAESIEALVEDYALPFEEVYAITDGRVSPKLYAARRAEGAAATAKFFPVRPCVGGDARVYTVALASIVARHARDELMRTLDARHPRYGFAEHGGYGTAGHVAALHRWGSLEGVHRRSFKQVKGR